MLDNTVVDMGYWEFKKLYSRRRYPLYYVDEPNVFVLMMFERHRAYRCIVLKESFQSSFRTNLSEQEISDIYEDFTSVGGLRSQAKLTDNLVEAMALGINQTTYKYVSRSDQDIDGSWTSISFDGRCKSFTIDTSIDACVKIDDGDEIQVAHSDGLTLEFDYKLVDPSFMSAPVTQQNAGKMHYFIDGEVL